MSARVNRGAALFALVLIGALAIVGPDDAADAETVAAIAQEQEAARPRLVRHELGGCAPDLIPRADGTMMRDCTKWAIYDDGREVLVGIVKRQVVGQSTARYVMKGSRK